MYAYKELKTQLEQIEECRFIFTSPTFIKEKTEKQKREFYIPRLNRENSLYGTDFEIKLKNEMTQKAIAFYEGTVKHIYFVAETKGSMNSMQLRLIEESKIHCAREHFKAISNGEVVYDVVDSYKSLLDIVTK